jgi:hypothetical protein
MVRHCSLPFNPLLLPKDYVLSFEDELSFVWRVPPRFSIAKLLFFAVGHVTFDWWTILTPLTEPLFTHNWFYPSFLFLRVRTAIGESAIICHLPGTNQ